MRLHLEGQETLRSQKRSSYRFEVKYSSQLVKNLYKPLGSGSRRGKASTFLKLSGLGLRLLVTARSSVKEVSISDCQYFGAPE